MCGRIAFPHATGAPPGEGIGRRVMGENSRKSISPLLLFALVTALFTAAAIFFVHRADRGAVLSRYAQRDERRLQDFGAGMWGRVDALLGKIQGAELLMAAAPNGPNRLGKALSFLLGGESRDSFAASVLLDGQGKIVGSRRVGEMPAAGPEERGLWAGASRSFLTSSRREKGAAPARRKFDIQSSILGGVPVVYLLAASPSTEGFWGVIISAESLLPLQKSALAPGESVFALLEPEQKILFARLGDQFLAGSVDGAFKRRLAAALDIPACCNPAAFSASNQGKRAMAQSVFTMGVRELRLVHVADRSGTAATGGGLKILDVVLAAGWLASLALFYFLGSRSGGGPAVRRTDEAQEGEAVFRRRLGSAQLALISRVSESVAGGAHFRDVIISVAGEVSRFVSTDRYYVALYDDGVDRFLELCSSRLGDAYRRGLASPASGLPERIALREKEIVEVPSIDAWHDAPEALKIEKVRGAVVFPMVALGKAVGVASFYFDTPRAIPDDEVEYCFILFQQAAVAISRAWSLAAEAGAHEARATDLPEDASEDEA